MRRWIGFIAFLLLLGGLVPEAGAQLPVEATQGPAPWRMSQWAAPSAQVTSAANTAVSIAPGKAVVVSIAAYCSAGTASLTITDDTVTVWSTPAGAITTTITTFTWTWPLSFVGAGVVQLGTCGSGNTGTLSVQSAPVP